LRQLIFAGTWQQFVQQVAAHWSVTVNVTNSGQVAGSEIVQVYAGKLPTPLPTAPKSLAGFAKVALQPGQSQDVTIALTPESLSYWDVTTHAWVAPAGNVPIPVGASSAAPCKRQRLPLLLRPRLPLLPRPLQRLWLRRATTGRAALEVP
jgi:fibronectin type III domain protein